MTHNSFFALSQQKNSHKEKHSILLREKNSTRSKERKTQLSQKNKTKLSQKEEKPQLW